MNYLKKFMGLKIKIMESKGNIIEILKYRKIMKLWN